ncbi:MAG: BRCT domain-containing protein [Verrucomicrobiota bacterium]
MSASNRQKKILAFFKVPFSPKISVGAAGWEIAELMEDDACRERWRRYLYLTKDFGSTSDQLIPVSEKEIEAVTIPEGWSSSEAIKEFQSEVVAQELVDHSPFDQPQPVVEFPHRSFIFTGKFAFGSRNACQAAVIERGAFAPDQKSITHEINYLVIGAEGSKAWKRGSYGNKIEAAILARREYGSPAIISEKHWTASLTRTS